MGKRAYSVTNSEMSVVFFGIGLLILGVAMAYILQLRALIAPVNQGIANTLSMIIMLLIIAIFFKLIGVILPNYMITKYNLHPFMDKISNPDYITWIRFTRDREIRFHTVKKGPHGQTKGVIYGKKADVINNGDYTITLPNGNKAICVYDFLATNANVDELVGWNLVHKHHGIFGYPAYEKAVAEDKLIFDIEPKDVEVTEASDAS